MRCWIAVASSEHVAIGRAGGFMQVCHGKAGPLRRIRAGDAVVYYSPTTVFGGGERLQAFTALGTALPRDVYQADMGGGFHPFRRDVAWVAARTAPIRPLLDRLQLCAGESGWGARLRFGLVEIDAADMAVIAEAMGVALPGLRAADSPAPAPAQYALFPAI